MSKKTPRILLQLSDMHVVPDAQKNSDWVKLGDALHRVAEWINKLSVRPEAVVVTGDLVDDGHPDSYACLKNFLSEFDFPVYVIPGNHDDREHLKAACPEFIGDVISEKKKFIQYAVNIAGVRLVALDTLETGKNHGVLCDERLKWLADTLAQEPEKPTIIAMHHPPFKTGMCFMDEVRLLQGAQRLEEIISEHKQVKRLICGHQHQPSVQSFGHTLAIVAPSTSHQLTLQLKKDEPLGYTHERPAAVLHVWHDEDNFMASHLLGITGTLKKILFD